MQPFKSFSFLSYLVLITLFSFVFSTQLSAQSKPKRIAYEADWSYHDEKRLPGITKLVGNVIFSHEEIVGYCDSAYLHNNENVIEAFGKKVIIHINDTVTMYGEYVIYNGDTRDASISRDVILEDNTSTLYTEHLFYDLNEDLAYYNTGGKMISTEDTLTSIIGKYYTNESIVFLYKNVHLINASYVMDCDSLKYNTDTEVVYFLSKTDLVSDENIIITSGGWYDTQADVAFLKKDVVITTDNQTISGDSIYYDKKTRFGIGWSNVQIVDTVKNYIVQGDYMEHFETGGISTVTDRALLILIDNGDSLYMHADTFKIHIDSLQDPQLFRGYFNTKFYRTDFQGACDSIAYHMPDSTLIMYHNPVIWSEEYQLTADTIFFRIRANDVMDIHLNQAGFIVSSLYEDKEFNQIKGVDIYGKVLKKKLKQIDVVGNAECIYYIQEEDSSLIGINTSVGVKMRILFDNNAIDNLTIFDDPNGKIYPDNQLMSEDRLLKDFRWLDIYHPKKIEDIYHTPIPRNKQTEEEPASISKKKKKKK